MSEKKLIILAAAILILIGAIGAVRQYSSYSNDQAWNNLPSDANYYYGDTGQSGSSGGAVACTMEAKLCPDGSYVGRTGPNCEFSPCPTATFTSASTTPAGSVLTGELVGQVTLGPTCPVEQNPPNPQCAPKPYQTTVIASTAAGKEVGRQSTDASGNFMFSFLPGTYSITAVGGTTLPRCETKTVSLSKAATTTVALSCDTGIR